MSERVRFARSVRAHSRGWEASHGAALIRRRQLERPVRRSALKER